MLKYVDHYAIRTNDKEEASKFYTKIMNYSIQEEFDLQFEDGSSSLSYALSPPHAGLPEVFLSEGDASSIVGKWVTSHGVGIHHVAIAVDNIQEVFEDWLSKGVEFTAPKPLYCEEEGLTQIFTKENPHTGLVIELIEREPDAKGFCKKNVKALMESSVK